MQTDEPTVSSAVKRFLTNPFGHIELCMTHFNTADQVKLS